MAILNHKVKICGILVSVAMTAKAQQAAPQYNTEKMITNQATADNQAGDGIQQLIKLLANLGLNLGYQLDEKPTAPPDTNLIDAANAEVLQNWSLYTMFGAKPVNMTDQAYADFVPSIRDVRDNNFFNQFANNTFQPSTAQAGFNFINSAIDQKTAQKDPVSQSVLNMLATPNFTYCMNYDNTQFLSDCKFKDGRTVENNVIGKTPKTTEFFSYDYIQQFLPELNSNTLLAPLWYSKESPGSTAATSSESAVAQNNDENQAQLAANFIRYASGAVTPIDLASKSVYSDLYNKASGITKASKTEQRLAQAALNDYLVKLRVHAAQLSVGASNLYYIFSKRLPQNVGGKGSGGDNPTASQALSEFSMASWRLYNPNNDPNEQWVNKLNNASPATVQKEIAILLAEMNYQLYLNRQQQERLLLTNTIQLFLAAKLAPPVTLTPGQEQVMR